MAAPNLYVLIDDNARRFGARDAYRVHRDGRWIGVSWTAFLDRIDETAEALIEAGVAEGDRVAIFSPNCAEWTVCDFACMAVRAVTVPIHATCTARTVRQILDETEPRLVIVGSAEQMAVLRESGAPFERVVVLEGEAVGTVSLDAFAAAAPKGRHAAERQARRDRMRSDDLWTIVYTSGTTGDVRGAMLAQSSLLYQVESHRDRLSDLDDTDSSFCLLPLSHIFERGWTCIQFGLGMTHHYCRVSPEAIGLLQSAQPSVLCVVPRVLEKIHAAVHEKFAARPRPMQAVIAHLLDVAMRVQALRGEGKTPGPWLRAQWALADRLVLSRIRAVFGGRLKHCVVGGAALAPDIHRFFLAAGVFVNLGYGLSETLATVASTPLGQSTPGSVGVLLPGQELRIAADGEIQVRGPNVMRGYYKRSSDGAVFTEDGYLRTGDVGVIDERGFLRITDRLKDLIKTSNGKYVAPQYIEARMAACPLIEQAAVVGDGRSWLGALLVPDLARLEAYARRIGVAFVSHDELVRRPEIIDFVKRSLDDLLADLARHERIQRVALLARPFTVAAGELTPTLKLRRKVILDRYREVIAAMFGEVAPA